MALERNGHLDTLRDRPRTILSPASRVIPTLTILAAVALPPHQVAMNENIRKHLGLVLVQARHELMRSLTRQLEAVDSQFLKGSRWRSGAHLKTVFVETTDLLREYVRTIISSARRISADAEGLELAQTSFAMTLNECIAIASANFSSDQNGRYFQTIDTRSICEPLISDLVDETNRLFDIARCEVGLGKSPAGPKPQEIARRAALQRLPEAELQRWWKQVGNRRDSLSLEEIHNAVLAEHPQNQVARQRIRELAGGRKRGRKPIGQKRMAD